MDTDARRARFGLPLLVGLLAIVAAFAGSASISARRAAHVALAPSALISDGPTALTRVTARDVAAQANAARPDTEGAPRVTLRGGGAARTRVRCAGCGVVESMRRIDQQEIDGGDCSFADTDRIRITGKAHDGGKATLADTVDGVLAGSRCARKMKVTSSYQFVVRLGDGSRRVFNEPTARDLQSGERVEVIAGASLPAP